MRGKGSPTSISRTRIPPISVRKKTIPSGSAWTVPMMVGAHGCQCRLGLLRRNDRQQLALVGDRQWIEAQDLASPAHFGIDRDGMFIKGDRDLRPHRHLV